MTAFGVNKSTIVRFKFQTLRRSFSLLERYAPGPGAVLATRLWCTPRHAASSTGAGAIGEGTLRDVPVPGGVVRTESWGKGPIVYLMHGWGGHRHQLAGLITPLTSAGYRVISFDALSHGESGPGPLGPKRANLTEFADALTAVVARFGPANAIVAHSMGGAAAALAILDGLTTERLVCVAPAATPLTKIPDFAAGLGFGKRISTRLYRRLETMTGRPIADFDIPARLAGHQAMPPLLVLHDTGDREVSHADGVALAASWPGATMVSTEGLGHRRILADRTVLGRVTDFLTSHEQPAAAVSARSAVSR